MTTPSPELTALAAAYGVATEFTDWRGQTETITAETITAVLSAMDVDVADPVEALADRELELSSRTLPPCLVIVQGEPASCPINLPSDDPLEVTVELEAGGSVSLGSVGGDHESVPIPLDLPLGYHTLAATGGGQTATTPLIVTPAWLGLPERADLGRSWGWATQLYSLRSAGSWGLGDLTDLADLSVWSAGLGADYVLVNPLHAAEPLPPLEPSPYLPSTRRFVNPIYLRVDRVPEYAALPTAEREAVDRLASDLAPWVDASDRVDRDAAWTAKRAALRVVHAAARSVGRELDYAAYREREGRALRDFAVWSVLAEDHGNDARTWPDELRDPRGTAVTRFADAHADRVDFACWLQWLLDEQLHAAQGKAVGAGMRLGVMHDLAVGVHPGGADAWRMPELYAAGVRVGAPPDPYNQLGQDWNQPPWRPDRLAEQGYQPWRDLVAAVLRHAGGVRVDHVIGLFRLWWIPEGQTADTGTYVRYDPDAMIGVLALEAHRAGAVVVGEDLGVVPPETRDLLRRRGILGTSILWFERDGAGRPVPAEQWREWCLASVTTHDLPPTAGYLAGDQVRLQHQLGLLSGSLEDDLAAARADVEVWLAELRRAHVLGDGVSDDDTSAVVAALHAYLTHTPSRLLNVALTDAVGERRTQNQPGTDDEYPNWRIPLGGPDGTPLALEEVFTSERAAALAAVVGGSDVRGAAAR